MADKPNRPPQKPLETFHEWTAPYKRSIPVTRGDLLAWLDKIEQERGLSDLLWTGLKRDGKRVVRFALGWFYRWKVRRATAKALAKREANPLIPADLRRG